MSCSTSCCLTMGPVRIRHRSHHFATQSSHFVDRAGWQVLVHVCGRGLESHFGNHVIISSIAHSHRTCGEKSSWEGRGKTLMQHGDVSVSRCMRGLCDVMLATHECSYSHFSLVRTISVKEKILYYRELLVSEKFFKPRWIPLVLPSPVILGENFFLLSRITC